MNGARLSWWLVLFAVPAACEPVIDATFDLPTGEWRFAEVTTTKPRTFIHAECRVTRGEAPVVMGVIATALLDRHKDATHLPYLAQQGPALAVRLVTAAGHPGVYAVVVENAGDESGTVRLHVRLEDERAAGELSAARRSLIVALSLGALAAMLLYAGRQLRPHLRG